MTIPEDFFCLHSLNKQASLKSETILTLFLSLRLIKGSVVSDRMDNLHNLQTTNNVAFT